MIKQIDDPNTKQIIARSVLESLRDWFEVDESREKYIAESAGQIFIAAEEDGDFVGFLCLKETGKETVELAVMGVLKEYHRHGLGRQLFEEAKRIAKGNGYLFMQVKTVMVGDRIRNRAKKCEVYAFDEMTRGYGNDIKRQERIETFSQRAYDLAKGLR